MDDTFAIGRLGMGRLHSRYQVLDGSREKVDRLLTSYAEKRPGYQPVKGCIDCSGDAEIVKG